MKKGDVFEKFHFKKSIFSGFSYLSQKLYKLFEIWKIHLKASEILYILKKNRPNMMIWAKMTAIWNKGEFYFPNNAFTM